MNLKDLQKKYKSKYPWIVNATQLNGSSVIICEVPPKQLPPNPKNWRTHNQRQRNTFKAFKEKHGWLGFVLFNLQTNKTLDGHMRIDEAIKADEPCVPVILVDKAEDDENEVLATLDNIGLLAQRNEDALRSLTKAVDEQMGKLKTEKERKLAQFRKDLQEAEVGSAPLIKQAKTRLRPISSPPPEEEAEPQSDEKFTSSDDPDDMVVTSIDTSIIFDGLTEMGIPELLKTNLATPDLAPRYTASLEHPEQSYFCYSMSFDGSTDIGCIGFYTDDVRFEAIYNESASFLEWLDDVSPKCLIGPDFSAYGNWPLVLNLYSVYKSRWCTRLWQQVDYPVIPTVQMIDQYPHTLSKKYVLETLPTKCTLAIEARLGSKEYQILTNWINLIIQICKPECLVLYAGEEKQKYIIGDIKRGKTEIIYLPQLMNVRKKRSSK